FQALREAVFARPLLLPVVVSLVCSVILIERRYGLVHEGFLTTAVLDRWEVPVFLGLSTVFDLTILATLDALLAGACRVVGAGRRRHAVCSIVGLVSFVVVVNVLHYNVLAYIGDWLNLKAALHVSHGLSGAVPFFEGWLQGNRVASLLLFGGLATGAAGTVFLGRVVADGPVPVRKAALRAGALWLVAFVLEVVLCHVPAVTNGAVATSLRRTSFQRMVEATFSVLTDWDGDGVGWIDHPADFAPFDASRSPFALEVPGNGVDEDGIGGDLPAVIPLDVDRPLGEVVSRPDILLVVPCTLRADAATGGPALGPSVMPNLARAAREGFYHDQAYSHCGHTTAALQQILSGEHVRHKTSLVSDMKAAGYQVGVISTQDESFGNTEALTRMREADFFADARLAPDARSTRYSAPSSIIMPAKWALGQVKRFLDEADPKRPVFIFVHLETCHYPYAHDSPEEIVPHSTLGLGDFTPDRRAEVVALYRNAAANLDRRLGELFALVEGHRERGDLVTIVMADHGESLYDDGTLGHGTAITATQTHVPLVIVNGWGEVPVPFGHVDVRPFILDMLATARPQRELALAPPLAGRAGPDAIAHPAISLRPAARPLFQWVGDLKAPRQLGLVGERRVVVDLDLRTATDPDGRTRPLDGIDESDPATEAIRCWESLRLLEREP
ncbi:MAG TPA: sulfatase-like hydrolase/transferase, partial [Planctomycetota bacterium]|nr:sulfatase-like hydrolase/transferase [Planctomycetota bacterium]